ncbi:MAG: phytoene/squalene synthase family protein [Polyangiales bacterium]
MRDGAERHAEDVARCREILRAGSKSFYAASLFLPSRVRGPASVIYAFCRVADDAVDLVSPAKAPAALERMRARLERVYADRPDDHPVDRALSVVVQRARLPREVPEALLEGFQWDVDARSYESLDELLGYCARVASTVGVMMTLLMDRRDHGVIARACDLGAAMQLTNICRDVGEDARNGRVYLPHAWLREVGVEPEALVARPVHSEALGAVVARALAEADALYRRADLGVAMLPRDCRVAIRAARLLYSEIGAVVRRRGDDGVTSRAVVSIGRKLWLLGRASFAAFSPSAAPAPSDPPPLDAVRFLLDPVTP